MWLRFMKTCGTCDVQDLSSFPASYNLQLWEWYCVCS